MCSYSLSNYILYHQSIHLTFYKITEAGYNRRKGDLKLKIVNLVPTLSKNSSVTLIEVFYFSAFYFEMERLLMIILPVLWENQVS